MNNKITLVESMAALRKQLHEIEFKTINEGLNKTGADLADTAMAAATKRAMSGEEILSKEIKSWLKKPATEINKEFKTIEITLPNGTKEVWNATGIKKGEVMYSRAGDNAIASFEDVVKSGTVKNVKTEPSLMPEPGIPPKTAEPTEPHPTLLGPDGKPLQVPAKPTRPTGGDEIKQVDVSGPDPLLPKRIDPAPFKNIEAAKTAADAEIQAGNAIVKAPDGTVFKSADDIESFIATNYPESAAAMAASPKKSMSLWSWFSPPRPPRGPGPRWTQTPPVPPEKPPAKHTKKTILLVALLIALGLYFWPKDKTQPGGSDSGAKAGEAGGIAPIGTVIPGDEIPWSTYLGMDPRNGDSLKKSNNPSSPWVIVAPSGVAVGRIDDPELVQQIEQLAKMDPEKRKEMAKAETTQRVKVNVYRPGVDGPELPSVSNPNNTPVLPPVSSEVPNNTTPDGVTTTPDIVIGKNDKEEKKKKDDAEKKKKDDAEKKKKDEKVLPSSKW